MYEDIYFLNSDEALRVASERNRWDEGYKLQVCYYDGEKIESDLPNLFHLPIDNLLEGLVYGIHRVPTAINFTGLDVSSAVQVEVITHFNMTIEQVKEYRRQLNNQYLQLLKNMKLDFNEPLRFYLLANSKTTVMQFISKSIADTLKDMGYEVLYNLFKGTEDLGSFKTLYEFNPHVTININHLNNKFLGEDVFNFIWFQDYMSDLKGSTKLLLRDRDFIFHLIKDFEIFLNNKGVNSMYQPFCIDGTVFKKRDEIKKEKKIVFIGSSYNFRIEELKEREIFEVVYAEAVKIFEQKSCLTSLEHETSDIRYLMDKYDVSEQFVVDIYAYLARDYCVEKLCTLNTDYEVEIYGFGWETNEKVKPYFKGKIEYGEDISKIYNSASFGFCPGGYILMQRTLECAFSETIPLVLDTREDHGEYDARVDDAIEYFHIKDLENILQKESITEKNFEFIREEFSYKHLVENYLKIIEETLSESK